MKASTILTLKQYAQSSQVGQNRLHLSLKEKKSGNPSSYVLNELLLWRPTKQGNRNPFGCCIAEKSTWKESQEQGLYTE